MAGPGQVAASQRGGGAEGLAVGTRAVSGLGEEGRNAPRGRFLVGTAGEPARGAAFGECGIRAARCALRVISALRSKCPLGPASLRCPCIRY